MIFVTTGGNGTAKTLITLKIIRDRQVAEGRKVYYNGFAMHPAKAAEFGWEKFDPKEWEKCDDGAILFCDEAHNQFPPRSGSQAEPKYVTAIGEHRARGFDFYLLTQHPTRLDKAVRKIVAAPGYHRHHKRTAGIDMVSVLQWDAVNDQCEKFGSGKNANVTMVPFPKEVYTWYTSAVLHTAKRTIPRQVYVLAACVLIVPVLGYFVYQRLYTMASPRDLAAAGGESSQVAPTSSVARPVPVSYLGSFVPRVPGLPHTPPRYDGVTAATVAPYPAACVSSSRDCRCFTQQGTRLQVPADLCKQIVSGGFFMDWEPPSRSEPPSATQAAPLVAAPALAPVPASPDATRDGQVLAGMRGASLAR